MIHSYTHIYQDTARSCAPCCAQTAECQIVLNCFWCFTPNCCKLHLWLDVQDASGALQTVESYCSKYQEEGKEFTTLINGTLPDGWADELPTFTPEDKGIATRLHSQTMLNALAPIIPGFWGGSAGELPDCLLAWHLVTCERVTGPALPNLVECPGPHHIRVLGRICW